MQPLNLPGFDFRISQDGGKMMIFDRIRRKHVALTPEEWVRQHVVAYLREHKGIPESLIGVEKKLEINGMVRRFDLLVFNRSGKPVLLVECKAPSVEISEKAFDQAARYNRALRVDYLVVTNGMALYCCNIDYQSSAFRFLPDIPDYKELNL